MSGHATEPVIGYATPTTRKPPSPWLRRIAVACGVIPLTVGVLDFIAWVVTSHSVTVGIGLLTLVGGFWIVLLGLICAITYAALQLYAGVPRRRWVKTFLLTCLLFAANFAAAGACLFGVSAIGPRHRVAVMNTSDVPLTSVVLIVDSNTKFDLGPLQPSQTVTHVWRGQLEMLTFQATFTGAAPIHGDIGYHGGMPEGTSHTLMLRPDLYLVDGRADAPTTLPSDPSLGR